MKAASSDRKNFIKRKTIKFRALNFDEERAVNWDLNIFVKLMDWWSVWVLKVAILGIWCIIIVISEYIIGLLHSI